MYTVKCDITYKHPPPLPAISQAHDMKSSQLLIGKDYDSKIKS